MAFIPGPIIGVDQTYVGTGTLGGSESPWIVTLNGAPTQARVLVYDDLIRNSIVANIVSSTAGVWEVENLTTERPFLVIYRGSDGEIVGGGNIFAV